MDTNLTLLQSIKKSKGTHSWKIMNELYRPMIRKWLQRLHVRVDDEDDLNHYEYHVIEEGGKLRLLHLYFVDGKSRDECL